jgi:hypothetical protein
MEYTNPFVGLPEANVPGNPFLSRWNQIDRQQTMQPFVDMAKQRSQLDLQNEQIKSQEFASPQAREARMSGFSATASKNKFDAAKATAELARLPEEEKFKYAELSNKIHSEEGKPYIQLFQELAGLSDVMEQTPEEHRPLVYKQWADRFSQTTGRPVPPNYQNYNPTILEEAKAVKYGLVMTPKHQQDLGIKGVEAAAAMARQNASDRAAMQRVGAQQAGANSRAEAARTDASPKNKAQIINKAIQILENPNATPDEKRTAQFQLRPYATEEYTKRLQAETKEDRAMLAFATGERAAAAERRIKSAEKRLSKEIYGAYNLPVPGGQSEGTSLPNMEHKQRAIQAWGSYDPNTYEYGVNPATGNFARKPKGK